MFVNIGVVKKFCNKKKNPTLIASCNFGFCKILENYFFKIFYAETAFNNLPCAVNCKLFPCCCCCIETSLRFSTSLLFPKRCMKSVTLVVWVVVAVILNCFFAIVKPSKVTVLWQAVIIMCICFAGFFGFLVY